MATDAGLLASPYETDRLLVAPSERVEIVVAFRPGESVVLRSHATGLGGGRLPERFAGGDDRFDLLQLDGADRLETSARPPAGLAAPPVIVPPDRAPTRTFSFNHASRINGRAYDHRRIDFTVAPDTVELWTLANDSDNQHVFHVHGVSFSVVTYDGDPPPRHLRGLKDSILLPAGTTARVAVQFRHHRDDTDPYMFHCHLLAHEDHGMMGQFLVDGLS